jgi:hypothetical protein
MTTTIILTRNDHGILLNFTCQDRDRNPLDLTAREVHFFLERDGTIINADHSLCQKNDSAAGKASYTLYSSDTATEGILKGRLRLQGDDLQVENLEAIAVWVKG